jgi:hypothetical protein
MSRNTLLAGAVAILAIAVVVVIVVIATSGGGTDTGAAATTPTAARQADAPPTQAPTQSVAPTATSVPPTETPPPPPPPEPTALPDRTNCDEIRGTQYRSGAEEEFYRANCQSVAPAGPTTRPSTGVPPPPPPPAASGGSSNAEAEATYRNKASAQLTYFIAQIHQWTNGTSMEASEAELLRVASIVDNFANTLDSLQPVPPRFQSVHNDLRSALVEFHTQVLEGLNVKTESQFYVWSLRLLLAADKADTAIANYNGVVGTNLPHLK